MHFKISSSISSHWKILGTYRQLFASDTFFKRCIWFFLCKLLLSLTFMQTLRIKQYNNLMLRHTHSHRLMLSLTPQGRVVKHIYCAISSPGDTQTFLVQDPEQPDPSWPCFEQRGADQMTSRVPFQPKLFCVSINLMKNLIWSLLNQGILPNHFHFANKDTESGSFKPRDSSRLTSDT